MHPPRAQSTAAAVAAVELGVGDAVLAVVVHLQRAHFLRLDGRVLAGRRDVVALGVLAAAIVGAAVTGRVAAAVVLAVVLAGGHDISGAIDDFARTGIDFWLTFSADSGICLLLTAPVASAPAAANPIANGSPSGFKRFFCTY